MDRDRERTIRLTRMVAPLIAALALTGCGSSGSSAHRSTGATAEPASTQPAATSSSAEAAPPATQYAVIADINPFGDSCAGADFLDVAHELQSELHDAGFRSHVYPKSDYPSIDGGQWCVQVGPRLSSPAAADALVNKLATTGTTTNDGFKAKVFSVGG